MDGLDNHWMDSLSDLELVARVQAGDVGAFEAIYGRHHQHVLLCLQRMTKKRDLAEEIAQETFVRALEKIDSFDVGAEPANLWAWLRRISFNICVNRLNRLALERRSTVAALEMGNITFPTWGDPSVVASRSELHRLLIEAIDALPELMAKCIVSHYVFGLSYEEICGVYALSQGSVVYLLHRGRRILAERLSQYF
jgi:RNA polymerase sigma-70 factor (ECF subfamily)